MDAVPSGERNLFLFVGCYPKQPTATLALIKTRTGLDRTGSVPEVVTWSSLHAYVEIPVLDGGSGHLPSFCWCAPERSMAAYQTPSLSKMSKKRLGGCWWQWHCRLSGKLFPIVMTTKKDPLWGEPRNKTKLVISLKQYRGLDSGRRYGSFVSRQLPIACSTSGTILQAAGSWVKALEQGTSFVLLAEAWHYFLCSCQLLALALL